MNLSKSKVREYWDRQPCGTGGVHFPEGSLEFFDEIENHRYNVESFIHSFAQFTRWHDKKVLEVGCGCGTDLLQFARAGAKVYGVDLSPYSIELVKQRLKLHGLQAEVEEGDAEKLPFSSERFDLVYSWGVLHHTPATSKAIEEIYRVLKPGGSIRIMIYHLISWAVLKKWLVYGFLKGRPFTSITKILRENQESPGTRAYTIREARALLSLFSNNPKGRVPRVYPWVNENS